MVDGQRRRTLTGHWLTTMVLEEVGRVFSALRCTHRLLSLLAVWSPKSGHLLWRGLNWV